MKQSPDSRFSLLKAVCVLVFSLGNYHSFAQQDSTVTNSIVTAIQNNRWLFTADRSDPPIGRNTGLSSGYQVRCTGDSIIFSLPYAGSMQGPARFPESKGPLDFTSTDFKITKVQKANGKWLVTVRVKDHYDVNSCTFTFFENGKASLDVMPVNRTPIDYYGSVEPLQ